MAWKRNLLVLANVTATSDELVGTLTARAEREPVSFRLVIPATTVGGGRTEAARTLEQALKELRDAGLEVEGEVGDSDPIVAISEAWDPKHFDEIVVSTLPMRFSKWLHAGLPERIERLTGAVVTHVVARPQRPAPQPAPAPEHEHYGVMSPLSVLAWGAKEQ